MQEGPSAGATELRNDLEEQSSTGAVEQSQPPSTRATENRAWNRSAERSGRVLGGSSGEAGDRAQEWPRRKTGRRTEAADC